MRVPLVLPFLPLILASACGAPAVPRYLFLTPEIVGESEQVRIAVNPAQRRETVIRADRPWEQLMISFFLTVREEEGRLRMWYICRDKDNQANVAYAESADGVHWTKPDLGIVDYHGSRANNLVGLKRLEGVVFRDPHAPAAERYTYVTTSKPPGDASGPTGLFRFHSPDGLRWAGDPTPLIRAGSDTQNVTFWDENLGRYVVYLRGWNPDPRRRKVMRVELPNLRDPFPVVPTKRGVGDYFFDEIPTVLQCDDQDPARTDIYNIAAQPYPLDPSWYVGFPAFLRRSAATDAPGHKGSHRGPVEVQFVGSRDGIAWHRYDRAPYAPPGLTAPEKKNMTFMGTGLVVRGGEIWQYGTEFESEHGDMAARHQKTDGAIVRWVQRVDGFVSANTGDRAGWLRTVPVQITGDRLLLNLDTGALGEMRVSLLDRDGGALPGFTAAQCDPLQTNSLGAVVSWAGRTDLSALRGRAVQLEFHSARARLYSFRFE
ncbi:MAG: hypothetical protein HZC55_27435 [Verrucomicrobia bacterium]|nr:hypothetical protein [Verrucomicrobiota bacterium]